MSDWQPIDTAPRDGTEILLWDGYKLCVASWAFGSLFRIEPKEWITGECRGDYNSYDTVDEPTHWLPLPETPP